MSDEKEIPKLSKGLESFLKKHTRYDGNNILVVQAPNGPETWIRTDQLISYGFKLISAFSEVDTIDHTLIFEHPEWRKRNDKGEFD